MKTKPTGAEWFKFSRWLPLPHVLEGKVELVPMTGKSKCQVTPAALQSAKFKAVNAEHQCRWKCNATTRPVPSSNMQAKADMDSLVWG